MQTIEDIYEAIMKLLKTRNFTKCNYSGSTKDFTFFIFENQIDDITTSGFYVDFCHITNKISFRRLKGYKKEKSKSWESFYYPLITN